MNRLDLGWEEVGRRDTAFAHYYREPRINRWVLIKWPADKNRV
jgi:hypothetical protein